MPDVFTKAKRSAVMSLIRGSGNKDTELRMIALFRTYGITGWRRGVKILGKPDFVFSRKRVALFVDGCFWHSHVGCRFSYTPKSRLEFWLPKFERNVARDRLVTRTLRKAGWTVLSSVGMHAHAETRGDGASADPAGVAASGGGQRSEVRGGDLEGRRRGK